jgi:hypothetical protein
VGGYIELAQHGRGDVTAASIMEACEADPAWRLVRFDNGAAALDASGDDLHITSIGALPEPGWMDQFQRWLECAAQATGKRRITCKGRKGWARRLARYGYTDIGDGYLGVEV